MGTQETKGMTEAFAHCSLGEMVGQSSTISRAAGAPLRTATIANGPKIAVRAASRVMRRTIGGLGFGDKPWVSENGVGYTGKKSKWQFFLGN